MDLSAVLRIDNRASQLLYRHLIEIDILACLTTSAIVLAGLSKLAIYGAQNSVHEFTAILPAERFRKLDRFIDRDLRGNFTPVREQEFVQTDAKNVPVDNGDFIDRPLWRRFYDDRIESRALLQDARDKIFDI